MPIDSLMEYMTLIGGSITAVAYYPHIAEIIKNKNSKGHSIGAWVLWLVGVIAILIYAFYIKDIILIALHVLYAICISLVIYLIYKYNRKYEPR